RRTPGDAARGRDPAPLPAPGRSSCTSNDVVNLVQLARPVARIAPSGEVSGGDAAQPPGERPATPRRRADGPRAKLHRLTRAREAWASSTEFCGAPERSMLEMPEQPPAPPGDAPPSSGVPSVSPNLPLDTVAVIGLGYIGLPTAAVLAQAGKTVIGVDVAQATVEAINAGTVPFVEEGLET